MHLHDSEGAPDLLLFVVGVRVPGQLRHHGAQMCVAWCVARTHVCIV